MVPIDFVSDSQQMKLYDYVEKYCLNQRDNVSLPDFFI